MSQAPNLPTPSIEQQIEEAQKELKKSLASLKKNSNGVIDESEKLARSARRASSPHLLRAVRPSTEMDLTAKFAALRAKGA